MLHFRDTNKGSSIMMGDNIEIIAVVDAVPSRCVRSMAAWSKGDRSDEEQKN